MYVALRCILHNWTPTLTVSAAWTFVNCLERSTLLSQSRENYYWAKLRMYLLDGTQKHVVLHHLLLSFLFLGVLSLFLRCKLDQTGSMGELQIATCQASPLRCERQVQHQVVTGQSCLLAGCEDGVAHCKSCYHACTQRRFAWIG